MSSLILSHNERCEGPWVKLQSEPSLFTALMYDLGVRGAKATEVFVLDQQDNFDDLGEIYGLVFLFKMIGDVTGDVKGLHKGTDYEPVEEYPPNVYFANQVVVENACATLAVLNIILNCPQLEIDQELKEFKEFTWDLPPATRGFSITNHPTLRQIHNSMARHPEDSLIVEEASKKNGGSEDEGGGEVYHYIAYVPIDGEVWQLDGLYPHPVSLGKYSNEKQWYDAVRGVIHERIDGFQAEQVEYVLLAITKDQIGIHQDRVKDCMYIKKLAEKRLDELNNAWREINTEDVDFSFTDDDEEKVKKRGNYVIDLSTLTAYHDDIEMIEQLRAKMIDEIKFLIEAIDRENKLKMVERERRTFDYGPFIREFISILHERGELKSLISAADDMIEDD
ncbi:19357_t:CDS:10 [Cetraspora pellucida]|uniref:ubiquitinyl hydrolase 1 n=1 Tax=Cetraspora pellucida TaxID=1433469 RepID=A0A9N8ZDJ6_9GLOM|nr:19357_t:CDS:10 [Cetraspora pellucida]